MARLREARALAENTERRLADRARRDATKQEIDARASDEVEEPRDTLPDLPPSFRSPSSQPPPLSKGRYSLVFGRVRRDA